MESEKNGISKPALADPSALGLFGLAVVTLVACSQKFELTSGVTGVMAWAIFLGGCMQLIAGIIDFKKDNAFGGTAFIAYGFFWLSMVFSWSVSTGMFGEAAQAAFDVRQTGVAFVAYLLLTLFMTIGSLRTNKVLFLIFFFIDLLFIGLALSTFGIAPEFTRMLAAVSELAISLLSFYGAGANVLNYHFKEQFLPLGKALWVKK